MNNKNYTRREAIKFFGLGMAVMALPAAGKSFGMSIASSNRPFTFAQICDTQLGFGGYEHDVEAFRQAVRQINVLEPDFVVICGDLIDDRAKKKAWTDFKEIKAGFNMPCHCASGNHEFGNTPTVEWLQHYRETIGEDYYSVEHNGYTFVVVNTQLWKSPMEIETAKQDEWLVETLDVAANKNSPVFIVGHFPLFLQTPTEADQYFNLPLAKRQELLALYESRGVVGVLGGHVHKLVINEYNGIQLVNGQATSRNLGATPDPLGFRIWHVEPPRPFTNDFISLGKGV